MEWLSLSNFAYLMVIIMGAVSARVAIKYKPLMKEAKEVFAKYHEAKKDGKIDKKEQQELAKECMDVLYSAVKLVWKF
tara:strand:- start:650 stop:883 length:234 start_codon:yes stop_codon:yes gene_type:complete